MGGSATAPAIGSPSPTGMTLAGLEQSLTAMLKNETAVGAKNVMRQS